MNKYLIFLTKDMPTPKYNRLFACEPGNYFKTDRASRKELEQNIQASYLAQLIQDYEMFMDHFEKEYPSIPVIRIDGDKVDFVYYQEHLDQIIEQISKQLPYKFQQT
jgi:deoxyguanosine kinase